MYVLICMCIYIYIIVESYMGLPPGEGAEVRGARGRGRPRQYPIIDHHSYISSMCCECKL